MDGLVDPRKRRDYAVSELVTAALMMFIFRQGSRNQMNLCRKEKRFRRNYRRLFKLRLPHMDTVDELLAELDPSELERLKAGLVRVLIGKKVFNRFRLGRSYVVSVDATHVASYERDYCGQCVWKTVGKGDHKRKVWMHYVLEAKLVTSSGLSISLASEWIANSGAAYHKQDCELKAFVRLAAKLKSFFPRLAICITGDGLYPNATVFKICGEYGWDFIFTFRDGNLPSVWEEVHLLGHNPQREKRIERTTKACRTTTTYRWLNQIDYQKYKLNWIEARIEHTDTRTGELTKQRFVHVTNLNITSDQAPVISQAGRMRWKIENQGFNDQKNQGYQLGHKFSQTSFNALQNYYQCLKIAHLINQLVIHSTTVNELLKQDKTLTVKFLWRKLISFMDEGNLENMQKRRCQIRLA